MAVLTLAADQLAVGYRKYPIDIHGKLRMDYMSMAALVALADIGSTIDLFDLPPGRVRLLPGKFRLTCSAYGASRTLAIGHRAYMSTEQSGAAAIAENASAFVAALDVSSALANSAISTVLKYDLYSVAGIRLFATISGGTIPVAGTLSAIAEYVYE